MIFIWVSYFLFYFIHVSFLIVCWQYVCDRIREWYSVIMGHLVYCAMLVSDACTIPDYSKLHIKSPIAHVRFV